MLSQTFLHLVNVSIMASWLVMAIVIFRLVFKKAPKYICCALWALVAIRLVFPVSFESSLSLIPSKETIPLEIEYSQAPAIDTGIDSLNITVNPIIQDNFTPSDELTSMNPIQLPIHIGAYLWQLGVVVMLLYALLSYLRIRFKVRERVKLEGNIYICDRIPSPFILGIIRPKIYLPSHLNEEDSAFVIAHEKAHIKRLDYIWKPMGYILLTVYWFNPLLWLGYILLCRDIEYACDEKVIREMSLGDKKSYSETLLSLSIHRPYVTACPLAFGESGVKGRIKSVLNYKKPAFWVILVALILGVIMAVCFLTNPVTKSFASDTSAPFVTYHKGKLYFNCIDGIYSCDENFENAEYLTEGYCDYSFVDNYVLYYIGESFENTTSIEAINLKTLSHKELYSSKDTRIYYLAPVGKNFVFADGDNIITMNSKGEILSEVVLSNSYVAYSNDDFLLYTTNKNTEIRKYDFETGESESVFTLNEGSLGWTVDCDGKYVYYTHVNDSNNSFCRYNMKNGKTEVLLEEGFGWEFVIDGNVCYFAKGMGTYNYGEASLYAFNIRSKKLTAIPCPAADHVTGLQIMGDYIVINSGNSSDHILSMQNLRDNTFSWIYHELEEKAGEALVVQRIEISAGTYYSHNFNPSTYGATSYVNLREDGTCHFSHSVLASFADGGDYEITDTELIINTYEETYVFDIIENGFVFNKEKSTLRYVDYISDGAVFTKGVSLSEYIDSITFIEDPKEIIGRYTYMKTLDSLSSVAEIVLYENDEFMFRYSPYSSQVVIGKYELTEKELILSTHNKNDTYVFTLDGNCFIFNAEKSTKLPKYKYAQGVEPETPIPDGARFISATQIDEADEYRDTYINEFIENLHEKFPDAVFSTADMDNNGVEETWHCIPGPTSGINSVYVAAYENNILKYTTYMTSGDLMSLIKTDDKFQLQCEDPHTKEITKVYDIVIANEKAHLVPTGDEKTRMYIDRYIFSEVWPNATNEISLSRIYDLKIYEYNGLKAHLSIDGYQILIDYICDVRITDKGATLYLSEYSGNTSRSHSIGTELLSIKRTEEGIITTWGAIQPVLFENIENPYCFESSNS